MIINSVALVCSTLDPILVCVAMFRLFFCQIVLVHEAVTIVEYLVTGLQQCSAAVYSPLLHALSTSIYENSGRLQSVRMFSSV